MKRPLFIVALLYIAGIVAADQVPLPALPLCAISLTLALVCFCSARLCAWLLPPLIMITGAAMHSAQKSPWSPHDLRLIAAPRPQFVNIQGTLVATPEQRQHRRDDEVTARTLARIRLQALRGEDTDWRSARGEVLAVLPGVLSADYFAGREVEVAGILSLPPGPAAEGLFNYRQYLQRNGIFFELKSRSTNDWSLLPPHTTTSPWSDRFGAWAGKILGLGFPAGDEAIELLQAMTLGWKTALNGEIAEPFMRSGTMHIFAISGLHITLIALLLLQLCQVFRLPRIWCGAALLPALWFYTAATGWQASAIRSTVMMSIIVVGWSLRRPPELLNSLAAAAVLLLGWETRQLFQAGFQLSFCVVLSLALFTPVLQRIGLARLKPDPLLPPEEVPSWRRWLITPLRHVTLSLATSLAAWLGSIPLVAYYFHLFTPVSLLANLLIVPLSGLALMSNMASLLAGGWFPASAVLFNHSAWLWMKLMIWLSRWTADLPAAWLQVPAPALPGFVLYYASLFAFLNPRAWLQKKHWRFAVSASIIGLAGIWIFSRHLEQKSPRLTVLPLHGGEAVYLHRSAGLDSCLIDCGNDAAARAFTIPFLRAQGVNHLPAVILTHGDTRNVAGLEAVRQAFEPREIFTSPISFRSTAYRHVHEQLEKSGRLKTVTRGDIIGPWHVLHPMAEDKPAQADDGAIVLRTTLAGSRILLLSDLGRRGQELLLRRESDLAAEIVIAGLPSRAEPLAGPLLEAIQPRVIIVTDAPYPATARANARLRQRLGQENACVLYTGETGGISLRFSSSGWKICDATGRLLHAGSRFSTRAGKADRHVPRLPEDEFLDLDED